jgi:hypothetical protein
LSTKIMNCSFQQQNEPSFKILVKDAAAALRTGTSYLEQRSNETAEQREVLHRKKSDYVQDFLFFSRPIAPKKFAPFLDPLLK